MFALAFTSFAPAYAAASPGKAADSYPPGYVPKVNLEVVYNPAKNQIILTTAFADNYVITRGDVSVSSAKPYIGWMKTATLYNTKQITLNYTLPRGSTGVYCANVTLSGGKMPGVKPTPMTFQGTASKCVVVSPFPPKIITH
jgi:hypothetical protein